MYRITFQSTAHKNMGKLIINKLINKNVIIDEDTYSLLINLLEDDMNNILSSISYSSAYKITQTEYTRFLENKNSKELEF